MPSALPPSALLEVAPLALPAGGEGAFALLLEGGEPKPLPAAPAAPEEGAEEPLEPEVLPLMMVPVAPQELDAEPAAEPVAEPMAEPMAEPETKPLEEVKVSPPKRMTRHSAPAPPAATNTSPLTRSLRPRR